VAKIKRENLNTKVYSALKQMITNHRFEPGERINVEQITKELGVSRTPIWEAIRRLEHEGLVVNSPNKGVFMYTLSMEEALDLIAVRGTLESMAARLAAERIDEKMLAKLNKALEKQKKIVENKDMLAYSNADTDFHALIYATTGNVFLCEMLDNIFSKLRPVAMHIGDFIQTFYEDHIAILNALKTHDPKKVQEQFRRHSKNIMNIIRSGELTYIRPGGREDANHD
jgi:DNA-binding GntR family transcriptional regulator